MEQDVIREAIGLAKQSAPRGAAYFSEKMTDTQAAIELGRINGWFQAIDFLINLTRYDEIRLELPEPDFGADDVEGEFGGN